MQGRRLRGVSFEFEAMLSARAGEFKFVVFSDDWGRHPSSSQHLFRRIVPVADVTWFNTIGIRTPRPKAHDFGRALEVVSGWMAGKEVRAEDGESRPNVLRPVMFPWFRPGLVSEANQWLLKRAVWKALHAEGRVRPAVLVSTLPIVPSLFESDWFARSIYYRVDDFASWEGVSERTMRALEKRTLEACDVMIAASTDLLRIGDDRGKRTALLTHGVDLEHFAKARTLEPPTGLARLPKPVIGTFGIFDARTDGELLVSLARRFSGGSIVILGPIDRSTGPFRALKNIHFIGKVPYAKLPEYVASFDACILPYLQSQILSPLKLKEYLATGKPVVSTPLQEAVRWRPHLTIADRDRFCDAVDAALGKEGMTPELFRLLREESWERKADAFLDIALDEL